MILCGDTSKLIYLICKSVRDGLYMSLTDNN